MNGWTWYAFLYKLADGDVTKIEEVGELNFMLCLNHLAYIRTQENFVKAKQAEADRNKRTIR